MRKVCLNLPRPCDRRGAIWCPAIAPRVISIDWFMRGIIRSMLGDEAVQGIYGMVEQRKELES